MGGGDGVSVIFINPYRFGVTYDADAAVYIAAVEAADGQALETAVKDAINAFVVGCKTDGTWNAHWLERWCRWWGWRRHHLPSLLQTMIEKRG
jgi:hypothetical protein